ncbi:MAG: hypothetical protein ACI9GZ_003342 [Bacteroidia bacterium]
MILKNCKIAKVIPFAFIKKIEQLFSRQTHLKI